MTTLRLDSGFGSPMLAMSSANASLKHLRNGEYVEALLLTKDRKDIVNLYEKGGLTRSKVTAQIKAGKGKEHLRDVYRRAGIAWMSACLVGMTLKEVRSNRDLVDLITILQPTGDGDDLSNVGSCALGLEFKTPDDIDFIEMIPWYLLLVIFGISCDVEMVEWLLKTKPITDEDKSAFMNFATEYGYQDPISRLLLPHVSNYEAPEMGEPIINERDSFFNVSTIDREGKPISWHTEFLGVHYVDYQIMRSGKPFERGGRVFQIDRLGYLELIR